MNDQKFFICKHCGNFAGLIDDHKVPMICCGDPMTELIPNTVDAALEKHVPVYEISDDGILTVNVGSVPHPMTPEHRIEFIYIQTQKGGQRRGLQNDPSAKFCFIEDPPLAVFAYCNLHGLWKTTIK